MNRAVATAWYILICLVLAYEMWVYLDRDPSTPTLTDLIVREVPWWVTIPFLVWLLVHFASRYMGRPIL
jgi:membrane-bound acyltransferase YfiQ involved in biofilm formation